MDVAAAKPAEIADANAVENRTAGRILVDDISDRRRADKEPVVVIVQAGIVLVPGGDKLCRVAWKKEILKIDVAEKDLLVAAVKSIEAAVGVFFKARLYSMRSL